jgi:hypothetical protein
MYLYGSFLNISGDTIRVYIYTDNNSREQYEIGGNGSGIMFADDPVTIESCVNDTFDHLLMRQATIRLLTRSFMPKLFCAPCMNAVVNIYKGDKCVFAGFIEPQAYSQNYSEVYDELEVSCIDALSALQYAKYRNIGSLGVLYEAVRANAVQRTFYDIISSILNSVSAVLDIEGGNTVHYYYDDSKALNDILEQYKIFDQIAISELLFLGEDEEDVWTNEDVLTAILKYLNLHIVQDGFDFYIYSWETLIADTDEITWKALNTGETLTMPHRVVDFTIGNAADTDTSISIGEVYNQISLTCDVEDVDSLIDSPLSEDSLTSPYSNRQKYMTEFATEGTGGYDWGSFFQMVLGEEVTYGKGAWTDWFIQVKNNPSWIFPEIGGWHSGVDLINKYCKNNTNQHTLPNLSSQKPCAFIVSLGKAEHKNDGKDNSPISKVDMTNYLVVSVNGNKEDDLSKAFPNDSVLLSAAPCAVYNGPTTGTVYSPADDDTINYIVLSGKLVLNPVTEFSGKYPDMHGLSAEELGDYYRAGFVKWRDGYRYYTQKYYKANTPSDTPDVDLSTSIGLMPFTDTGEQLYEFKYSAKGSSTDLVSKVPVLECMLIIGNKCVVETGTAGQISDFEWRDYKPREECVDDDEYFSQCFTIGFDPKIGDKLIGVEYDLQNNIDYTLGIDAEGIAIPVRKSDKLSGAVQFLILGPVNTIWGEVTHRHRTWFRGEKWKTNDVPLLSHISNILIENFEVKMYSDNGLINDTEDNDLIYVSDTKETFVNKKDDITFEINSALTKDECQQIGVSNGAKLSTAIDLTTGNGLLAIHDFNKQETAKAEQLYVDAYYTEYHTPRLQMAHKMADTGDVSLFNRYRHPAMPDKLFIAQGIGYSLRENYAELNIKETWND